MGSGLGSGLGSGSWSPTYLPTYLSIVHVPVTCTCTSRAYQYMYRRRCHLSYQYLYNSSTCTGTCTSTCTGTCTGTGELQQNSKLAHHSFERAAGEKHAAGEKLCWESFECGAECLGAEGASAAHKQGSRALQHTMLVLLELMKNQVAEPWFLAAALTSLRFLFLRYLSILS